MPKKAKCLLLFSGGLDSILTAKVLMGQGFEVLGLIFKSCFFNEKQARLTAKKIGLKLKIVDFSKEHLKIVKNPKYGYGKNMNPCIDCHLLMLKKAGEIMFNSSTGLGRQSFCFVATGEVLGERPMSQNKNILKLLEKQSGLKGYLLRPLSAKLLKPTIVEKEGIVNREKLLSLSGRQRKEQFKLAKKFKIKEYPTPSGGCCLTYKEFSQRLKGLLGKWPKADCEDIKLLNYGRHFWEGDFLIIVGRDDKDNQEIKKIAKKGDLIIEFKKIAGPTTLIRVKNKKTSQRGAGQVPESVIEKAKELTRVYSKKSKDKKTEFKIIN